MSIFSLDVQRRVRLRNAKKFDLHPVLGEAVVVHIGELPQSQQGKLLESVELRRELLARLEANPGAGESVGAVGPELASKLLTAQQELIAAALLDVNGDRVSAQDARTLLELLPINEAAQALVQEMLAAVYERLGNKKPAAEAVDAPAAAPLGK